jgi:hypothetical protein
VPLGPDSGCGAIDPARRRQPAVTARDITTWVACAVAHTRTAVLTQVPKTGSSSMIGVRELCPIVGPYGRTQNRIVFFHELSAALVCRRCARAGS